MIRRRSQHRCLRLRSRSREQTERNLICSIETGLPSAVWAMRMYMLTLGYVCGIDCTDGCHRISLFAACRCRMPYRLLVSADSSTRAHPSSSQAQVSIHLLGYPFPVFILYPRTWHASFTYYLVNRNVSDVLFRRVTCAVVLM